MLPPEDLYEIVADPEVESAGAPTAEAGDDQRLVLVHALAGFVDAGSASTLAVQHLLAELPSRVVARFDVDQLHDYRARRPRMVFTGDRFDSVDLPELLLHELRDTAGRRFLLLVGPEPDVQWQRFAAAVTQLVRHFGVDVAVSLQGIPWAAPHTRPVGLTAHASDRMLISGRPRWFGTIEVPGHAGSVLELHLDRAGTSSMGFSVHVPHYLATSEFPSAALTLLTAVSETTGLDLPTAALAEAATSVLVDVDAQVAASEETRTAVDSLERQYDAVTAGRGLLAPGQDGAVPLLPEDEMANGEELAAELERYLRQQD
ncbi:MAG: FIG00994994: hypothetical protein [uncultured Quadrisphaera sp.]|uniref:PAC2 family protein n=1 Tax=uncultured Quadrisphaera sp. TaxID=904978 RepID=A0A6J4Q5K6_9ACTN|nr:MAG: FIG00994994: hypothetical protein [uncultured Quadrisphaera sp.]